MDQIVSPPEIPEEAESSSYNRALLVDDSASQRRLLARYMGKLGYDVTEAKSGAEALALCSSEPFDLIVSDWMMPGLTGPEWCKRYREIASDHYGYFILVTSKSDKVDVVRGLDVGADDFLSKPVSGAELGARIRAGERILTMQRELSQKNRLVNETLDELRGLYGAIDRDLAEARQLQQSLVPERSRAHGGSRVAFLHEPCGHIGGDLVGSFRATESIFGVFSIDVAGHGVASALLTARLAGLLTGARPDLNVALTLDDLGLYDMLATDEVCARLNAILLEEMDTELYFTMQLAKIDAQRGVAQVTQAGHPPLLHLKASGEAAFLGDGGMPIGLLNGASYSSFEVPLAAGDRLLLFSDGITECSDPSGAFLEEDGLMKIAKSAEGKSGPDFLETLSQETRRFAGGQDLDDDVSAVLLDYAPNGNA